jgi:hypothetical protein
MSSIALVIGLIICTSAPVQAVISNEESMEGRTTLIPPSINAICSDNIVGWTNYGANHVPGVNDVDYSATYNPGDPLDILIDCLINHNDGRFRFHFVFYLEVYLPATWANLGNPDYLDQWIVDKLPGQTGQWGNTLQVLIPNADSISTLWMVLYICEVWNLSTGQFDIEIQNYWIVID